MNWSYPENFKAQIAGLSSMDSDSSRLGKWPNDAFVMYLGGCEAMVYSLRATGKGTKE